MPVYRVTFGFSGGGEGWSETHLYSNATTDFNTFRAEMSSVAAARAQLLGSPFYVYSIRVSLFLDNTGARAVNRSVRLWKGDTAGAKAGWYNQNFALKSYAAEPSQVAYQAVGYAGNGAPAAYAGNQNQTFLGGAIDETVDQNGQVFPAKLDFQTSFNAWAGTILKTPGRWGWGASQILGDLKITAITQVANGTVRFAVELPIPVGVVAGKSYPARVRAVNNGSSPLNGAVIVTRDPLDNTFTTKEVIGIALPQTLGYLKVYQAVPAFVPYGAIELSLVTVKHKRGKSPAARPGRAKRRIRG